MRNAAFTVLTAAGALLVFGSPVTAQKVQTPINDVLSSTDVKFMKKASQGNIAEIMMSELAMSKSPTKSVREAAWMIAQEHKAAQDKLKRIAREEGVAIPTTPNARQKAEYRRLSRLSGSSFDREFLRVQAKAHLDAIGLYQMQNRYGRVGDAVIYARETLPVIQNHTSHVTEVADNLNIRIPARANEYAKEQGSVTAAREVSGNRKAKGRK